MYTSVELKKATAKLKKEIIKAKKESWVKFIDSINPNMNSAEIWRRIKCINGRHMRNFSTVINNKENADFFLALNFRENRIIDRVKSGVVDEPEFQIHEVINKINKAKNTAPGYDNITYKMLKEFSYKHIELLTKFLNDMWFRKEIPKSWKIFKAYPLPKPGKDKNLIENYRSLTLISTLCKITNGIIKDKISDFFECNCFLPENSFGFRKGKSTHDYILKFIEIVTENKKNDMNTIAVIVDLEKAFDYVCTDKLLS